MYVTNLHSYGHLINEENFETNHVHNDMYSIFQNRKVGIRTYGKCSLCVCWCVTYSNNIAIHTTAILKEEPFLAKLWKLNNVVLRY